MERSDKATKCGRPASRAAQRRVPAACTFCRRRKIKCNNERPVCANCVVYDQTCIFEPVSEPAKAAGRVRHLCKKGKPISEGDQQNPQNQQQHNEQGVDGEEGEEGEVAEMPDNGVLGAKQDAGQHACVSRVIVLDNGVSSYHGRTSTLFEDNTTEKPGPSDRGRPRMPDGWVERELVAEAVRQHQMEDINFRASKLDFDGVDPDLGLHLLSLHWNRQHHSFLITYRPAFMRDMACNGPYFSKLLLNAIYFGASKFSPRLEVRKDPDDVRTAGWQFRQRVAQLLGEALGRSEVTTIQALLVMTNSLFALGDERSAAWLYSGIAFRMITDLGMHIDLSHTGRFSNEDLEIQRRVFWGAFVVDKTQSLYQGRPVSLKGADALVPIKFLDTYEELKQWKPFSYSETSKSDSPSSPAYSISTFASLCKLSLVMDDILSTIYTERSSSQSTTTIANARTKLHQKLQDWFESLQEHLRIDAASLANSGATAPPHVFSLHAMYHVLIILLHRPFVADGHLYTTSRSVSVDSLMKCATAAAAIVQLLRKYHVAFSIKRAPYLISYATYVAATILTRIASRRNDNSKAHADLATCIAVFEQNQETNSAVRKANFIIQNLMKKLVVNIPTWSFAEALSHQPSSQTSNLDHVQSQHHVPTENPNSANNGNRSPTTSNIIAVANTSPVSDILDVDSIIQSFLQGSEAAIPVSIQQVSSVANQTQYGHDQINTSNPTADVDPAIPNSVSGPEWQPIQFGDDHFFLEDPLFGFNGSVLDNYSFLGWD